MGLIPELEGAEESVTQKQSLSLTEEQKADLLAQDQSISGKQAVKANTKFNTLLADISTGKMALNNREDLDNLVKQIYNVQKTLDFVPASKHT